MMGAELLSVICVADMATLSPPEVPARMSEFTAASAAVEAHASRRNRVAVAEIDGQNLVIVVSGR